MAKKLIGILVAIIVIVLIYFLNKPLGTTPALGMFLSPTHGFWKSTSNTETRNQSIEIKCVKGNATVVYDEIGVPHIFADNEEDLMYAQGYVEAKDRLWQMEFQMYAAAGRLTELVGEKALPLDRFSRRIGLVRAAKNSLEEVNRNPISKMIIESFTAGVNAYIHQLKKSEIPVEYKLIGYTPEDWTPLKCALLMKYMAKDLTYYDTDVENTNALHKFGEEAYKKMYPDFPFGLDPIIPKETKWNFKSVDSFSLKTSTANKNNQAVLYKNPYKQFYSNPNYGSNNWCINGSKTASGKPILCGDPHLGLNLPSIWYEVQLSCPGLNVYGVTIPGAPGVIIGHNDSIAWSVTNSERDVINNYSVEYDAKKTSYKLGNEFVPFEYDEEIYKIKDGKDFKEKIKITKIGAVVYDENFGEQDDKKHLATYWRAEEPSNDLMAFYYLNKAKNHQDYLNALNYYACPGQNFIYADASNNIAIRQQGNFMLRTDYGDGSFITPLANVDILKLKARIPNEQNPYILNPTRNFCASANQNPVDENYPYYTNGHYENYRNRVINDVLTNASNYTWKDMAKLHNNNLSLMAKESLPTILSYLNNTGDDAMSKKIISTLKSWNYYADANSEAPTFFYKLGEEIQKVTYDEMDNKASYRIPESYNTANLLVNDPKFILFDIQNTDTVETAKEVVNIAFKNTVAFFTELTKPSTRMKQSVNEAETAAKKDALVWQHYKNTTITHLARLKAFSVSDVNIGGYHNIVNACSDLWGPSWRMIVDFTDGKPQCYGVYPGGQSGNPASLGFTEFIEKWAKGEYFKLHFYANKAEAQKGISKK
ncbi:MAG: penicillin acylase family protein [Saprospirales bacterium]|nr:penicillin acylase family protein [Saprospirales bacterium]